jgi:anti-sigma regulatory factor (Ser/Thr protein kinase)
VANVRLDILNAAYKGRSIPFRSGLTFGSADDAAVRAQGSGMRPVHARLVLEDGRPTIEIVDDQAHIHVNGKDVVRAELRHLDEIAVGPIRLKVVDGSRTSQAGSLEALLAGAEAQAADEVRDFAKEDLFFLINRDPGLRQAISFAIPGKDRFIEQAQVLLGRLAKGAGLDEPAYDAFMTCAKELILNAHRHGHRFDEAKRITIRWRDLGDQVRLTITDEGPGFDHAQVLAAVRGKDAAAAARERYQAGGVGGLGFQLITRLAHSLTYNTTGNEVVLGIRKAAD